HDISRIRSTPIPYVYHNLEYARYVGHGRPVTYKDVLIAGFDKIRKGEMPEYYDKFAQVDKAAKDHIGHKILVMHQGISEINKFAGELSSTDLPKNFTYYAMGHLHDHTLKQFSHLSGPVAYPGSTEMTTSEGIKESQKGFYEVDISGNEATPNWIRLDTRPQLSQKTEFDSLEKTVNEILEKISKFSKKPIVEIKISGDNIELDMVQNQMARLAPHTLHYVWRLTQNNDINSSVLLDRPASIDDELIRLASNCLGKTDLASFAIKELLPLLSSNRTDEAGQMVIERFEQFKRSK
ncbi:MAG: metallophosphoesterase, partial [Thaumarchaeota archaeon]|nr:metallophosphoesterase [Nitrososphaerota archaeon]